ncbi:hypothetical protein GCM10007874_20180 [Labrys miyagiensis]|uniref:Uncharacterized protein n=1 Tax=Labrys miyagiensis TaxID=346912 RepID=A0ABQ6CF86_9HYPH|nr:hypothetical protein [Labrys miyagiensis]GLS19001.1 hypothetical protein GCM10007874_20180 [Labrys miyagiensis]
MPRVVVIDKSVIDQINAGNVDMARVVRNLATSKAQIWMTRADYSRLFRDAEQRMLGELNVSAPLQDISPERYERQMTPGKYATDWIPHESTPTAALALAKDAELLSADRNFMANFAKAGGRNMPERASVQYVVTLPPGDLDYAGGRRLLGLPAANIGVNGRIRPSATTSAIAAQGAGQAANGPRTPGGARTTAQVGEKIEPVNEGGLSQSGVAKFDGATLGLKGVNLAVQAINDAIQKQRMLNRWAELRPSVEKELDADPEFGALIIISYWRGRGDENSAIEPVTVFQDIRVMYGWTQMDAVQRSTSHGYITAGNPGESTPGEKIWFPPKRPIDPMRLPTPWPVAGLATFVPGKEKLTKVKFSVAAGFDDMMFSKEALDVPDGAPLRFVYLFPPDKVSYMDWNGIKSKSIDLDYSTEADTTNALTGSFYMGVPVVKLDSIANPYNTTAAMVWPADEYTRNVFRDTRDTDDGNIIRKITDITWLRWVKPEFMRIIRDISWDNDHS